MAVQFNIKDPQTVGLARRLAARSGKSVTETIRQALIDQAERQERDATDRLQRLRAAIAAAQAKMTPEMRRITSKQAQDSLYDDGVPA